MAHTPGTWKKEGLSVITSGRGIICKCPSVASGGVFNVEANVRLIAAAPALMKIVQDLIDFENTALMDDHVPSELIENAKQALTEAKGRK